MRFKHYEGLRTFCVVARHGQISSASEELSLTKGAISHQIKALENELGFDLFHREVRGMRLTQQGQQMLHVARTAFDSLDRQIMALREDQNRSVTLGVSTYFASRWLSPKLMKFTAAYPKIRLRIQPLINFFDLAAEGVDIAIRWGDGKWADMMCEELFKCPAFPVAAPHYAAKINQMGLAAGLGNATLLVDRDGSTAWAEWFAAAGLPQMVRHGSLTIPDPNVRVQAVIDGQGVAINDLLLGRELEAQELVRLSDVELANYGYHLALPPDALNNRDVLALRNWLKEMAEGSDFST